LFVFLKSFEEEKKNEDNGGLKNNEGLKSEFLLFHIFIDFFFRFCEKH
jgi:hypothetical protein